MRCASMVRMSGSIAINGQFLKFRNYSWTTLVAYGILALAILPAELYVAKQIRDGRMDFLIDHMEKCHAGGVALVLGSLFRPPPADGL